MSARQPVDRATFISTMRHIASSVTVVTTNGAAGKYGATVSAFASVSADPPSVMVCLRSDSRIAKAVKENDNFAVCVLPQGASDTAMRFAGSDDLQVENRFSDVPHMDWDAPHLDGSTSFSCDVVQAVEQGSHTAFFGTVSWAGSSETPPLIYFDGAFGEFTKGTEDV